MNRSYESHMTVGVERKFRNLENRIMEDVVRRIKKTGQITSFAELPVATGIISLETAPKT